MRLLAPMLVLVLSIPVSIGAQQGQQLQQGGAAAQPPQPAPADSPLTQAQRAPANNPLDTATPDSETQIDQLVHAVMRLPVAAVLASVLALRPRRRGTPRRQTSVIQTQIILALVGAVVMLVVGTSLARAFGIVGAAGLVRYRAKVSDPKDAGVMLSTLAIGLAAGVGLWMFAIFATLFILGVLWTIESFAPRALQAFMMTVKTKEPAKFKPKVEQLLARHQLDFEIRTESKDELAYEIQLPYDRKPDRLSNAILKLDPTNLTGVEWEEKKEKK